MSPDAQRGNKPTIDERWEMKRFLIDRDGLSKGCCWCRKPFADIAEVSLEHIIPLADGGPHSLENCALACFPCNSARIPVSVLTARQEAKSIRAAARAKNLAMNGGEPLSCPTLIFERFEQLLNQRRGKMLMFHEASHILKRLHREAKLPPPSSHEKHVFKGHFNRWTQETLTAGDAPPSYPREYSPNWVLEVAPIANP